MKKILAFEFSTVSPIVLKYPSFHVLMGKTSTKLAFLHIVLKWIKKKVRKRSILASEYTFLGQNRLKHTQLYVCEKEESPCLLFTVLNTNLFTSSKTQKAY